MGVNFIQKAAGTVDFIDDQSSKILTRLGPRTLETGDRAQRASQFDDFIGKTISTIWDVQKGSDGATANFAISADTSGKALATTGAGAGASMAVNGVQLSSALNWKANQGNLVFECKVKISAITTIALYVGFTDQLSALEMPATLASSDVLTTNYTDGCGFLFDTAADTDNWWLIGVANDVDATKQNTGVAPVADTYETLRIELTTGGAATFYRNGAQVGTQMTGAVTATVALTPVVVGFTRAAGSATISTDYIFVQQDR